jgi:hypothetical protein
MILIFKTLQLVLPFIEYRLRYCMNYLITLYIILNIPVKAPNKLSSYAFARHSI